MLSFLHTNLRPAGLALYGYRYYDPETGRWTSRDPLFEKEHRQMLLAENSRNWGLITSPENVYNFAFNDGINLYDVNGEWIPAALRGTKSAGKGIGTGIGRLIVWNAKRKAKKQLAKAQKELAERQAKKIAECEGIHASYDAFAKQAGGCRANLECDEYKRLLAARAAEIAGRALYLKKCCDYKLPGSIAKPGGSALAKKNHETELANKIRAFGNCTKHALIEGCVDLPSLP